jgi:hypothetical protein
MAPTPRLTRVCDLVWSGAALPVKLLPASAGNETSTALVSGSSDIRKVAARERLYAGFLRPFKHVGYHPQFDHIATSPWLRIVTDGRVG